MLGFSGTKALIVLIILFAALLPQAVLAQDFKTAFSMPTYETPNSAFINARVEGGAEYNISMHRNIISLSMNADVYLADRKSFARVVLVDDMGKEYLVYQADFIFEEESDLEGVCEETCVLIPPTRPAKLLVEASNDGSSIFIERINYLVEGKRLKEGTSKSLVKNLQTDLKIKSLNNKSLTWTAGDTPFCDLSYEEKKDLFGGWFGTTCGFECYTGGVFRFCEEVGETPSLMPAGFGGPGDYTLFDWRDRHNESWMTPVKDQGDCGSCWAFSAVGAVEGVANVHYNQHLDIDLSEQDLVSCTSGSCGGGSPSAALTHIRDTGIVNESCFPYTAANDPCFLKCENGSAWRIAGYSYVNDRAREIGIKKRLAEKGPLSMAGPTTYWSHAIVLSGYGYGTSGLYWIFKNSWGPEYFDMGYGKISISTEDLHYFTYFYSITYPIPPAGENHSRFCFDKDSDGFCSWGIGNMLPACSPDIGLNETGLDCCSSLCQPEADHDDSNASVTTFPNETLLCGDYYLAPGGEEETFGSYFYGDELGCCGDDPDEYLISGGCCSDPTKFFSNGECFFDPTLKLYSGTEYPPAQMTGELIVQLGSTVHFEAVATSYGNPEGVCNGCVYEWYKDGLLQPVSGSEYSAALHRAGVHKIRVAVTDNESKTSEESMFVSVGTRNITANTDSQLDPQIQGDIIVWTDYSSLNSDIYLYNISAGAESRLTGGLYDEYQPDIYGERAVWVDSNNMNYDIFMRNISSVTITQITNDSLTQNNPVIYGDIIVWVTVYEIGNSDIFMYNISSGVETQLTNDTFYQLSPDISGDRIVWLDYINGTYEIVLYDMQTGNTTQITSDGSNKDKPRIDGDRIVWHGFDGDYDIYLYEISTGTERQITNESTSEYSPDIHNDIIVWGDTRNGNYDIYMYDLAGETERQLTANRSPQMNPMADGSRIVWEDYRKGNYDIYMVQLEDSLSDVNSDSKVDVVDLALVVFWQGKSSSDPDWSDSSHLDADREGISNGVINLDDVIKVILNMGSVF
jgi:beta propeller repeat protein